MIELSDNVVNELLDKAIAEKGADYVYPGAVWHSCRYFEEDKTPGCLVGHIMNYVGITVDDIVKHDDAYRSHPVEGSPADLALGRIGIKVSANAGHLLNQAQESQDAGYSWGQAVADARAGHLSGETGGL